MSRTQRQGPAWPLRTEGHPVWKQEAEGPGDDELYPAATGEHRGRAAQQQGPRKQEQRARSAKPQTPAGSPEAGTKAPYASFFTRKTWATRQAPPGWGVCRETSSFPSLRLLSQEHSGRAGPQPLPAAGPEARPAGAQVPAGHPLTQAGCARSQPLPAQHPHWSAPEGLGRPGLGWHGVGLPMFGRTPSGTWGVCGVTGTHRGQGHRRSAPSGQRPCTQEEQARAGTPGRGSEGSGWGLKARPLGTSRGSTRPVDPQETAVAGAGLTQHAPPPWQGARGHRRQEGRRTPGCHMR